LTIPCTTPDIKIDIHGVKIGAWLCSVSFATNEAGILNELFLRTMIENWFDTNWTIEIHDLFKGWGMYFN
jgi:hypothetical protein